LHLKHTFIIRDTVLIVLRLVRLKNISDEFWRHFRARAPLLQAELKIEPRWLSFDSQNIPTLFGTHFLLFFICMSKNSVYQIFMTFSGPSTIGIWNVENGALMIRLSARNVLHFLGCNSYRFASVRQKTVSVKFWQLFRSWAQLTQPKLKTGPRWLRLAPQTYPYNLCCSFYRFLSVRLKNNSFEFCRLFGPRYDRGGKSWKSGPYDSVLHPKHTHNIRDTVLIVLRSVRPKNVSDEFWRLFQTWAPPL